MYLDAILPAGISALLPNLNCLAVDDCALTPAARTSVLDVGCSRLRSLVVVALSAQAEPAAAPPRGRARAAPQPSIITLEQLATVQLRQLTKLPNLSTVVLMEGSYACPTLFLAELGAQLTSLDVAWSYRQCEPATQTPTPVLRATLQHVARCTRLQDLTMPCQTAEELGLVAPALQQLRTLGLSGAAAAADGDAMMEALLGLPHLTNLHWGDRSRHTFQGWYNDRPCRWERLTFCGVSPQVLARLPLHSLKQPVEWDWVMVDSTVSLDEVRAAVANVVQSCPAGT